MDIKVMESYLDNIAEQVVDEDKIVTYKSLSRSLGIHVNTAKQLLHTYLTNEKSRNSFPVSATYLVAGKVVDGSFNITIVNEADLKEAHSKFVEVTSEHVYSVQKGKTLKDLRVLCAVDKESSKLKSINLVIKCSKGVLKLGEEVKKKPECYEESNKKVIQQALVPESQNVRQEQQPSVPEKTETIPNESTSKGSKKTSPKGSSGKAVKKPAGNIANLFAKAVQKNAVKAAKPDKGGGDVQENEVVNAEEMKNVESKKEDGNLEKISATKEGLKKKKKGSKRKRIQMLSDSEESDSDDEGETVNLENEESPPPPPPPSDPAEEKEDVNNLIPRNKRKKRKIIDKTVMNEDGYLETRKEVVFETDSENEVEEVRTAPKEQKKPKINPADGKGKGTQGAGTAKKQSSLLTFFKKS